MNKRRAIIVAHAVLMVCGFLLSVPMEIEAQDSYMFLSKKGARWEYEVTVNSRETSILTIVNEGARADINSTIFSWTFRNALGVSIRMELFYEYSLDGILLSRIHTHKGPLLVSSQRYEPPLLALKLPLTIGHWENKSFRISDKGDKERGIYSVVNTVRRVRIAVPAGIFDAFEIQGQESTGGMSIEYWVEHIGLVGFQQTHPSGTVVAAQLVRYSHLLYDMIQVGTRVFSHRQSWGCASPELLVQAYRLEAYGHGNQEAIEQLERIVRQKKCIKIDELQGYIVHRRGDSVQINGRFPPDRAAVMWVPIWSVAVCHRILCGAP